MIKTVIGAGVMAMMILTVNYGIKNFVSFTVLTPKEQPITAVNGKNETQEMLLSKVIY